MVMLRPSHFLNGSWILPVTGKDAFYYTVFYLATLLSTLVALELMELILSDYWRQNTSEQLDKVSPYDYNALYLLSKDTVNVLKERDFLVVFGIPSLDIPMRRWRRRMQRTTCWRFPEVATRQNNFNGAMLVLFLLARHQFNNFILSRNLIQEAEQWQDVLIHPMNEGKSSTRKLINGQGFWGPEAEIGSSRKTFFWFYFTLRQFPRVPYIAKGDDDMFLRVPQYLADLRRLPRRRIYWGGYVVNYQPINKKCEMGLVKYVTGYCVTLARDAVDAFVSFEPLRQLIWLPYRSAIFDEFRVLNVNHEDAMIGRVLNLTKFPAIFVAEDGERFHRFNNTPPTANVVVTHTPKEHEYHSLFNEFLANPTTSKPTRIIKKSSRLYFMQPPL